MLLRCNQTWKSNIKETFILIKTLLAAILADDGFIEKYRHSIITKITVLELQKLKLFFLG